MMIKAFIIKNSNMRNHFETGFAPGKVSSDGGVCFPKKFHRCGDQYRVTGRLKIKIKKTKIELFQNEQILINY